MDRSAFAESSAVPEVFRGSSPREVLFRLAEGDPLEIGERCRERMEFQCVLVELSRLQLRALALVARAAPIYRGRPGLDAWLRVRIDEALEHLVEEDIERSRDGEFGDADPPDHLAALAESLGLELALASQASTAINILPWQQRRVAWGALIEQRSLVSLIEEGVGTRQELLRDLHAVLQAIRGATGRDDLQWDGGPRDA